MSVKDTVIIVKSGIDHKILSKIEEKLEISENKAVTLILDTYGGDPTVGYRVMRLLQSKFETITAIVPDKAYSAGTLMALGADEIYMGPASTLGPLDTQIQHPTDGGMVSSLEIRENLNTLAGHALTYANSYYDKMMSEMNMGKERASTIAFDAAVKLVQPIADKIDPVYLQISRRTARVGQTYAKKLLEARMLKEYRSIASKVSYILANNYDFHGYAIMRDEARDELLLTVLDLEEHSFWVSELSQKFADAIDGSVTIINAEKEKVAPVKVEAESYTPQEKAPPVLTAKKRGRPAKANPMQSDDGNAKMIDGGKATK